MKVLARRNRAIWLMPLATAISGAHSTLKVAFTLTGLLTLK